MSYQKIPLLFTILISTSYLNHRLSMKIYNENVNINPMIPEI